MSIDGTKDKGSITFCRLLIRAPSHYFFFFVPSSSFFFLFSFFFFHFISFLCGLSYMAESVHPAALCLTLPVCLQPYLCISSHSFQNASSNYGPPALTKTHKPRKKGGGRKKR
jgi:hypothetical protein